MSVLTCSKEPTPDSNASTVPVATRPAPGLTSPEAAGLPSCAAGRTTSSVQASEPESEPASASASGSASGSASEKSSSAATGPGAGAGWRRNAQETPDWVTPSRSATCCWLAPAANHRRTSATTCSVSAAGRPEVLTNAADPPDPARTHQHLPLPPVRHQHRTPLGHPAKQLLHRSAHAPILPHFPPAVCTRSLYLHPQTRPGRS